MPAHRVLNQLEFEGMPPSSGGSRQRKGTRESQRDLAPSYPEHGAHDPDLWGRGEDPVTDPNPIYDSHAFDKTWDYQDQQFDSGRIDQYEAPEFVPPWRVTSPQGEVNLKAVEHQVQHANPLRLRGDDPLVLPYEEGGAENYVVMQGNHRVLAAQRRGQLLMPATVRRWE